MLTMDPYNTQPAFSTSRASGNHLSSLCHWLLRWTCDPAGLMTIVHSLAAVIGSGVVT